MVKLKKRFKYGDVVFEPNLLSVTVSKYGIFASISPLDFFSIVNDSKSALLLQLSFNGRKGEIVRSRDC